MLYNRNRDFGICKRCDYRGGMRQGFIPRMDVEYSDEEIEKLKVEFNLS